MKLSAIATLLGIALPEGVDCEIVRIGPTETADPSSITFVSNFKYLVAAAQCRAAAVIVKKGNPIPGKVVLEVDDPYLAYARVAQLFEDRSPLFGSGTHATALVDTTATIAPDANIGPAAVVGAHCVIGARTCLGAGCIVEPRAAVGEDCRIDSGVVIRRACVIGNRVIIQSGAVIGSEGFGLARNEHRHSVRIPCFGIVIIEDDVQIGANVTIDRGNFGPTRIGQGVYIDNLVHIAHNVTVGEHSVIIAQVGISGSTRIGKRVSIWGQAGLVGHIEVGDDAFIGAQAGVAKNVAPGAKVTGAPAREIMTMRRMDASLTHLPDLLKQVKALAARIETLEHPQ